MFSTPPPQLPGVANSTFTTALVASCFICVAIYWLTTRTDIPYIEHLPEIPRAFPLFGHLFALGDDHATVCENWWHQYGPSHSVFQIRLGNTRAVVVNSFKDVKTMLVGHQSAVIDRPTLYTFHGVISSTQGFTIGSSPWDASTKNRRQAAGKALGRASIKNYNDMFDLESYCITRDLYRDSRDGQNELNIRPYLQRYALNTTLTLCYGLRMDNVYDDLLREILEVGSAISLLRSASENYQDYVPLMRWAPRNEKTRRSKELRQRRDTYLDFLLDKVKAKIERGTDRPCIASAILKDEETKLTNVEVSSICLSLVSGGFETIPGTLTSCIGSLSTAEGQRMQELAYEDLCRCYPKVDAADSAPLSELDIDALWRSSFLEEKSPYLNAIVKEAARYYAVSALSLPRKSISPIKWTNPDGTVAIIPSGTMILINAQAANHDLSHFGPDAAVFDPSRWLVSSSDTPTEKPSEGIPHFSFGAGSRACSGQIIAQRLLYTALARLLSCYRIVESKDPNNRANTDYVEYNAMKSALVAIPKDFEVGLRRREGTDIEGLLGRWEKRTAEMYVE